MSEDPRLGPVAEQAGQDSQRLEWQVVLARQQPGKAAAALGVVVALLIVIDTLWGSSLWTGIAAALFFCAIGDFFFPLRQVVGPEGASSHGCFQRQRLAWEQVARCLCAEDGFWLEARRPNPGRRARGLFLWAGKHRAELSQLIARYRPEALSETP